MLIYCQIPRSRTFTKLRTIPHAPRGKWIVKQLDVENYSARGYWRIEEARHDADRLMGEQPSTAWNVETGTA